MKKRESFNVTTQAATRKKTQAQQWLVSICVFCTMLLLPILSFAQNGEGINNTKTNNLSDNTQDKKTTNTGAITIPTGASVKVRLIYSADTSTNDTYTNDLEASYFNIKVVIGSTDGYIYFQNEERIFVGIGLLLGYIVTSPDNGASVINFIRYSYLKDGKVITSERINGRGYLVQQEEQNTNKLEDNTVVKCVFAEPFNLYGDGFYVYNKTK